MPCKKGDQQQTKNLVLYQVGGDCWGIVETHNPGSSPAQHHDPGLLEGYGVG